MLNIPAQAPRYANRTNKKCESIDTAQCAAISETPPSEPTIVKQPSDDLIENGRLGFTRETLDRAFPGAALLMFVLLCAPISKDYIHMNP
jgi:hypothetical protein